MSVAFGDSPRKGVVRTLWNTPVLKELHTRFGTGYFYWGLPGPDIIDIRLWKSMIRRVVAFEMENPSLADPRRALRVLDSNLAKTGIPRTVYSGFVETTVLQEIDDDGIAYVRDPELVTLYNLDFCNSITGRVKTKDGQQCLRFEVLRRLLSHEQQCFAKTGESRFIVLLTVREEFHRREMANLIADSDKPAPTAAFLSELPEPEPAAQNMQRSPSHLKAFILTALRTYCQGQNIATYFLPPVRYTGRTSSSPMMHFFILCRFAGAKDWTPPEDQTAADFLRRACMRASDNDLTVEPCGPWESVLDAVDPVQAAKAFFFGPDAEETGPIADGAGLIEA